MREEYWRAAFWLFVIGSWVFGISYGRWSGGGKGFFLELSRAVRIPSPMQLNVWWEPLVYFVFTVIAIFVLSQLFFGVGAAVFLFSRGVYDSAMIAELEAMMRGWSFPDIPMNEVWTALLIVLILVVNLPLCLWAAHIGTQRSMYMWYRLTGKPVRPEASMKPITSLLLILAASIAVGLAAAFIFSYIQ
ncbi:MAG: hypothetical protein QMC89_01435 [Candidatus Hodarchaeaceae archaeon]|nr:hypothetical protein [Candidatus Hodarchaeaceae archaeon]